MKAATQILEVKNLPNVSATFCIHQFLKNEEIFFVCPIAVGLNDEVLPSQQQQQQQHSLNNNSGNYGAFDTTTSLQQQQPPPVNNNTEPGGSGSSSQFSSSNFPVMSKIFSHPTDTASVTSTDLTRLGK